MPVTLPPPQFDRFGDPAYRGPIDGSTPALHQAYLDGRELAPEDRARAVSLYDGETQLATEVGQQAPPVLEQHVVQHFLGTVGPRLDPGVAQQADQPKRGTDSLVTLALDRPDRERLERRRRRSHDLAARR